jgi:hypothetical protein
VPITDTKKEQRNYQVLSDSNVEEAKEKGLQ